MIEGIHFAPDHLHKANISGGTPYGVLVPSDSVDPMLDLDGERMSFVEYLNLNFRSKGFRLARKPDEVAFIDSLDCELQEF